MPLPRLPKLLSSFALSLVVLGSAPPLLSQTPDPPAHSPWKLDAFAGLARTLGGDALGTDLGLGLGLSRRLGASSRLGLDVGYLRLGSQDTAGPTFTLFPVQGPATFSQTRFQSLLHLGLRLDQRLSAGPIRPRLLLGVSAYRLDSRYHYVLRDSTATRTLRRTSLTGAAWGPGASLGLGIGLARVLGPFTPQIEARIHFAAMHSQDTWTTFQALTAGLRLSLYP